MKHFTPVKTTLLLASMMTIMAAAIVSPALPQINQIFKDVPYADLLTRLLITLPALFIAAASPVFGYLIDNKGGKKPLIISLLLYAAGGSSGYFLNDLHYILLGRIFLGIAVGGIMTISNALIYDYFHGDERSEFVGYQNAFAGLGGVIFIAIAGLLSDIQWQLPFLIYGFSIPVVFMVNAFIKEPGKDHARENEHHGNCSTSEYGYSKRLVMLIYFLIFIGTVFFFMLPVQMPYMYKGIDGVTNSMTGFAIGLSMFATSLISFFYKHFKKRFSFAAIYIISFSFMAFGYTAISYCNGFFSMMLAQIFSSIGIGFLIPSGNLWIMEIAPAEIRGRLIGRASTAIFAGTFLSPFLIQPVISYYSVPVAFRVSSIFMVMIIFGFLVSFKYKQTTDKQQALYLQARD